MWGIWEFSVLPSQFFYKPKNGSKIKKLKFHEEIGRVFIKCGLLMIKHLIPIRFVTCYLFQNVIKLSLTKDPPTVCH